MEALPAKTAMQNTFCQMKVEESLERIEQEREPSCLGSDRTCNIRRADIARPDLPHVDMALLRSDEETERDAADEVGDNSRNEEQTISSGIYHFCASFLLKFKRIGVPSSSNSSRRRFSMKRR